MPILLRQRRQKSDSQLYTMFSQFFVKQTEDGLLDCDILFAQ